MELLLTKKQGEVFKAVESNQYKFILFGGGVGSGKTVLMSYLCISHARKYPNSRMGVFRKNIPAMKRTTFQTFLTSLAQLNAQYVLNRQDMIITFPNGSEIYFMALDESEDFDFNKIKSLELTSAYIDEANEVVEKAFNVLITRIGRQNDSGQPFFILMTCNPSRGWIKHKFYDKWKNGQLKQPWLFIQALPTDNPFLHPDYLEMLKNLPPLEYKRYVLGDWDYEDIPNQLITFEMLKKNQVEILGTPNVSELKLGVDVARTGDDSTVFSLVDNDKLIKQISQKGNDITATSETLKNFIIENSVNPEKVNIDVVGLGAGVVDNLRAWGFNVQEFNSASSPSKTRDSVFMFGNRRAEAYWDLRQRLLDGRLLHVYDEKLYQELLSTTYFIRGKSTFVSEKDKIKKTLGRSPDLADSLSMAVTDKEGVKIALV